MLCLQLKQMWTSYHGSNDLIAMHDVQEAVKGSQGAGRVDDALDSTIEGNAPVAEPSKPKGPARPPGAKGKKKGTKYMDFAKTVSVYKTNE